jgi:hypothetical protein
MDGGTGRVGKGDWSALLARTRQALANFRAEELEQLAARAEGMLAAERAVKLQGRGRPAERGTKRAGLAQEHHLLGELLLATDRNIEVVRRLLVRFAGRDCGGEGRSRWAR